MNVYDGEGGGREHRLRLTPFETLTKLILPALLVLAYIVTLMKDQRVLAWALLGLFVLSLVAGFYRYAAFWAKTRMDRARDERTASRAFPELRKFVEQFGEFVSRQRCDTVHYVAQSEVCGGDQNKFNKLGMPNMNLFDGFWHYLRERAANQKRTSVNFKATNSELSTLVSLYNNYCMRPVFELLPQELRSQLPDSSKSSLEACRERFVAFLNDYSKYLKGFDEPFAARYLLMREFPSPKPLR
jgi:hypothetical protein